MHILALILMFIVFAIIAACGGDYSGIGGCDSWLRYILQ